MTPRPRKLLAAAPILAAALAGCGTTAPPAARATVIRAPVTAPAAAPAAAPAPAPAPERGPEGSESKGAPVAVTAVVAPVAATPMCDGQGRPLPGNVRTKDARSCSLDERQAGLEPQ